jgi:hypothetical protein
LAKIFLVLQNTKYFLAKNSNSCHSFLLLKAIAKSKVKLIANIQLYCVFSQLGLSWYRLIDWYSKSAKKNKEHFLFADTMYMYRKLLLKYIFFYAIFLVKEKSAEIKIFYNRSTNSASFCALQWISFNPPAPPAPPSLLCSSNG